MIQVNLPNIVTITLAGVLGYALLVGLSKLAGNMRGGSATAEG